MSKAENTDITVSATINAPVEKVWKFWTDPKHIVRWNHASDDWHTTKAENDLRKGGTFVSRMEARDGSIGFDFAGQYTEVSEHKKIEYVMADGRRVRVAFESSGDGQTGVTEMFDAEGEHSPEMQRSGWQSILDNFKRYVESSVMEKVHFSIKINARAAKVFETIIGEKTYGEWTSVFNPSSRFKGSWNKGSKILFLGESDGKTGGMVSRIKDNIPDKYISIEHVGVLQGDKEITSGPEVEGWAGSTENYTLSEQDGQTVLSVDMDSTSEYKPYFESIWPKALEKLKSICEIS